MVRNKREGIGFSKGWFSVCLCRNFIIVCKIQNLIEMHYVTRHCTAFPRFTFLDLLCQILNMMAPFGINCTHDLSRPNEYCGVCMEFLFSSFYSSLYSAYWASALKRDSDSYKSWLLKGAIQMRNHLILFVFHCKNELNNTAFLTFLLYFHLILSVQWNKKLCSISFHKSTTYALNFCIKLEA